MKMYWKLMDKAGEAGRKGASGDSVLVDAPLQVSFHMMVSVE